ncbi:MAG: lysophospholipid acyltransferase family protein, partial [Planctomycetes bacterium]|nr:lysophospholipid acyltransferase family protein [Planctomycetota bacterium]
ALTWRVQRGGERGLELLASERPWIVSMWHGRMLCLMPMRLHKGRGIHVLVSPSDDGSLAARALRSFRFRAIRGSLSRGGATALRTMRDLMTGGGQLVVTPDGPRGPRHATNAGVAWLARATGSPVLPVGVAVDRAWRLRSWDRFTIPKPFARLVVAYGEPVEVAATTDDAQLETIANDVRERTLELERDAFRRLGITDDHTV